MNLRVDIQVMRGVAVLVVVLFHLDYKLFANGFLGVDLFFVISGFLMAILYRGGKAAEFYTRRASRLLPAYFVTVLMTLVLSAFIVLPSDYAQVSDQSAFATFFLSNFGFWLQDSYFDSGSFKPLLHLWSLGVEIQFYFIVPLLLCMHRRSSYISLCIVLFSLLACLALVTISSYTAFFLTPFRVWQFLIGAAAALYFTDNGRPKYNKPIYGLVALIVLLGLIVFYPVNGKTASIIYGHPGISAVITSLATAVILVFGLPQRLLLSWLGKAFKKLGDWSYSIYLAHFPVIVLFLYKPFSGTILSTTTVG